MPVMTVRSRRKRFDWFILSLAVFLSGCGGDSTPPNIVFICLDTVRADYIGPDDSGHSFTPRLDVLAAEGTVFDHAFSAAPWTVPAHVSFFTGLLPSIHRCQNGHMLMNRSLPTLADHIAAAGYQTAAFFHNPLLSDRMTGLLRGFALRSEVPLTTAHKFEPEYWSGDQGGRATIPLVEQWLDGRDPEQPFFLFLNILEAHLSYDPAPQIRQQLLSDLPVNEKVTVDWSYNFNAGLIDSTNVDWRKICRFYEGDVMFADLVLGQLIDLLKGMELYEDTVFIVTSDHGENLGDHNLVDHKFSVHETLLAVPLVVRAPSRLDRGLRADPVVLTDLFATILDLANIDPGVVEVPGTSLSLLARPIPFDRPLVAHYAPPFNDQLVLLTIRNPHLDTTLLERGLNTVRVGDLRLTVADDGQILLHDLAADPQQKHDLSADRPDDVANLLAVLDQYSSDLPVQQEDLELDEQTRDQLRSLGYVH